MQDWNAKLYSKFKHDRTLPAIDLANSIDIIPKTIIDIGCGIGNSTAVLAEKFPNSKIIGADSSDDMLKFAASAHPSIDFQKLDAEHDLNKIKQKFDLVFSNACIQWIPDHKKLLKEMMGLLNEGGTLAVQIPSQNKHPMHTIMKNVAVSEKWSAKITSLRRNNVLSEEEYFDTLSELSNSFRMWETTYFHEMPSHQSILEWYKGTGLRPYLDQLSDEDKILFEKDILSEIEKEYPLQANGSIIFRFPRLFFIAQK